MGNLPRTSYRSALGGAVSSFGRIDVQQRTEYLACLQDWNARLVAHLRTVRILDAVRWPVEVERDFLAHEGRELPRVTLDWYRSSQQPLNGPGRLAELRRLEREIIVRLGSDHAAARLLLRRCRSAQDAVRLVAARGTKEFVWLSRDFFGSSLASKALRDRLGRLIAFLEATPPGHAPVERLSAECAANELTRRLHAGFGDSTLRVVLASALPADACAGAGYLKLRREATFTQNDVDMLEVHEGWVHLGTSRNGDRQPLFTLLTRCAPCATTTQEGLAVLTELLAGVCHPVRRLRLAARLRAVVMAEEGADFLEVYRFFLDRLGHPHDAYRNASRVFRGSLPQGMGPFTKDLSYGIGLLELVARLRTLEDNDGRVVPLLFAGKTCLDDLSDLESLNDAGLLIAGEFVPPPFRDRRQFRQSLRELGV